MKTLLFILLTLFTCSVFAQDFDHSTFDALLKKYVDENGMVNYKGFKTDKSFDKYLDALSKAEPDNLSKEEKLAFYINAYNAFTIKNVVDHYPITSPMKVDKFFDNYKFNVAGKKMSLNQLEYDIILKIEPVLSHFGLVCAAKSCPKLLQKAYTGKNVVRLLTNNAGDFIHNPEKNKLDEENKILYVSEIFKWFKDSFTKKYGSLKETALRFLDKEYAVFLKENDVEIKFMKYNWTLNEQ